LRKALKDALRAFLQTLDEYTLADFLGNAPQQQRLVQLWRVNVAV
jgi:DNA-binding IscR family transcriptional regulator